MKQYDYILVGAGLFSGVINYLARQQGKKCLVVERRDHMGGNVYCEDVEGIHVHKYGAHIFHTSNKKVWKFVNDLVEFNRYTNSPIANYKGEIYNMPFNMNTFSKMWGVRTPQEAKAKIDEQRSVIQGEPRNLEEQAISLVGTDIYQKLVKGYTEKQWGRDCKDLPSFIIKRLPVRFTYDNNYFNDAYQGIPMGGYNVLVDKLFEGADVELGVDFLANREKYEALGDTIIYTGAIDAWCWTPTTTRAWPWSTTPTGRPPTPGSSSTSTLSSAPSPRPSSPRSTPPTGRRAWSPTTPSTTSATRPSINSMPRRPPRSPMSSSAADWASTSTMTWTRLSSPP